MIKTADSNSSDGRLDNQLDVMQALDIAPGTALSRLFRAREALKAALSAPVHTQGVPPAKAASATRRRKF